MKRFQRTTNLINVPLQLKHASLLVGMTAFVLLLQHVLLRSNLHLIAGSIEQADPRLVDHLGNALIRSSVVSLLLFLPLVFLVGIITTFRIAGPIYRFEKFIKEILEGGKPAPCVLRQGDALQDFCKLINQVTAPMRSGQSPFARAVESPKPPEAPPPVLRRDAESAKEFSAYGEWSESQKSR